jgi:bifunctional non-homologous end joining protein LigD
VIGGFTLPTNGIHGAGALLLGYYRDRKLIYAGRTGTGFTQKIHRMLRDRLDKLRTTVSPFAQFPVEARRGVRWVKPELVAQITFSNWTADDLVRQAAFKGLREDKPAKAVEREEPAGTPEDAMPPKAQSRSKSQAKARTATSQPIDLPIRLTHPDKVLDDSTGITKEALARYYQSVADVMLPYIADRPLTLVRCLDGSGKPCFYQKHKNEMLGSGFSSVDVVSRRTGEHEELISLSTTAAIIELAQIGVLEVHPWGSKNDALEFPDRIIFDLDPDQAIDWRTLAESAQQVRERLKAAGLKSFVKSTGGKGLHVVAPIVPEHSWPDVKDFAHNLVLVMEKESPKLFLTKMTKAARMGKIFLDYLRNDRGATAVALFSPRARIGLPVAIPLSWNELDATEPPSFHVSDFDTWKQRLSRDPWKEMLRLRQSLKLSS